MNIRIELREEDVKTLVANHLSERLGSYFSPEKIIIETKSKQNYKSEWERAAFRVVYEEGP